jgi:hypothetical protein
MSTRFYTLAPRDRLVNACETALVRLERKAQSSRLKPQSIFAETGEVLFWLAALGDTARRSKMNPGLYWARNQYAHGNLLSEVIEFQHGSELPLVLGKAVLGARSQHLWMASAEISRDKARAAFFDAKAATILQARAYAKDVAGRPVIETLRAELARLT